jgi:hypothetical protein
MSTGSAAKLHHYVPQAYLRGFATDDERITAVPLDQTRKAFTTSVKNVAARTHFHTVPEAEEPDWFEKALGPVEADAIAIIRRMEAGEFPLPEQDRIAFAHYVALQAVRGPDTRTTLEDMQATMVRLEVGAGGRKNVKAWIKNYFGFDATDEQAQRIWEEATQPGGPPITIRTADHIKHLVETAEHLAKSLYTRPWSLVRFERRSLITCDAPVSLIPRDGDEPWQGVGFGTAWGVTIPLTRKLGLLMSDAMVLIEDLDNDDPQIYEVRAAVVSGAIDRAQAGTAQFERLFNEHTAISAREYIFRHPDDAKYVPANLHAPNLINIKARGFADAEFSGKPWFGD